jgi:hypothetical protein
MPKVLMLTRSLKVTLISAQENIDETPGRIQRIQVERGRSRYPLQDGPESKERRRPRQATFSHLSVRDTIDGREIRTVATDPERARLCSWL